jgi:hypothetical protein
MKLKAVEACAHRAFGGSLCLKASPYRTYKDYMQLLLRLGQVFVTSFHASSCRPRRRLTI